MQRQNHGFESRAKVAAGFSLIELLIVVAIILIIAAIAIPNMVRAKMAANESSAASSVRQISRAEMAYYAAYPDHGYADALTNLSGPQTNCLPSSTTACIIDPSLASGLKSGYNFTATGVLPSGGINTSFVAGAAPVTFNSSGTKDFCSVADGVLRAQTGASGDVPATDPTVCVAFPGAN
jgi:type IV pilus assembly protein PilA